MRNWNEHKDLLVSLFFIKTAPLNQRYGRANNKQIGRMQTYIDETERSNKRKQQIQVAMCECVRIPKRHRISKVSASETARRHSMCAWQCSWWSSISFECMLSTHNCHRFRTESVFRCRCGGLLVCAPYEKSHPRRVKTNRQKVLCLNWKRNWSKRTRTEIQKKRLTAVFAYFVVNWFGFLFRCEKFERYTSDGKYGEKNRTGKTRPTSESGQFFFAYCISLIMSKLPSSWFFLCVLIFSFWSSPPCARAVLDSHGAKLGYVLAPRRAQMDDLGGSIGRKWDPQTTVTASPAKKKPLWAYRRRCPRDACCSNRNKK